MNNSLGMIEGFYGPLWSWQERTAVMRRLATHGYDFYIYAPKADPYLRRRWDQPYPPQQARQLAEFAEACRSAGVRFGVGLSPFEIFKDFDAAARSALAEKLAFLDGLGVRELAILFDDMSGRTPDLARRQIDILHWIRDRTRASTLSVCPTYYSDDPVLDRVFGRRPADYLETLGAGLDPLIRVFWTGQEVCSREVSPGHLQRVGQRLQRKPVLWDNYPVNDGDRMSGHLHLRGFTGRAAANAGYLAGHAINPALQPTLTLIPALTLAASYLLGSDYEYAEAFWQAAREIAGKELADCLQADLLKLEDAGLERLGDQGRQALATRYQAFDHPAAREILRWLAGEYRVTDDMVQTQ